LNNFQKEKVEKDRARAEKAKQLEKSNEADSKKLLDIAEKTPTDKNIKLAEDSILKVKNAEVKKAFDNQVVGIKNRVKLQTEAKTAVSNYQKDDMNNDKYKTAQ
jgi:peptidoglycan DL-endopeptidase CwlO